MTTIPAGKDQPSPQFAKPPVKPSSAPQTPRTSLNPPSNLDAELSVLGAMVLGKAHAIEDALATMNGNMFYRDAHKYIFTAIQTLVQKGSPVDLVTLEEELSRGGKLALSGGLEYLMDIFAYQFTTANLEHYCEIVRDKYLKREIIEKASSLVSQAYQDTDDAADLLDDLENMTLALGQTHANNAPEVHTALEVSGELAAFFMQPQVPGAMFGVREIDNMLNGLRPGEMTVVGARPACGKTACMCQWCVCAAQQGKHVLIASCEMTRLQIWQRMAFYLAKIDSQEFRQHGFRNNEKSRFAASLRTLAALPITIIDNTETVLTAQRIASIARRQKISGAGLDILAVDYIQKVRPEPGVRYGSRDEAVTSIAMCLKDVAMMHDCAVLALAQINRAGNDQPRMEHLRESGGIEAEAANIILLHIDKAEDQMGPNPATAQFIIDKQREGKEGVVPVTYDKRYGQFRDFVASAHAYAAPPAAHVRTYPEDDDED